jgi:hypothetical protein
MEEAAKRGSELVKWDFGNGQYQMIPRVEYDRRRAAIASGQQVTPQNSTPGGPTMFVPGPGGTAVPGYGTGIPQSKAQEALQMQGVESFGKAKEAAMTASLAARDNLQALDVQQEALNNAKVGPGSNIWQNVNLFSDALGMSTKSEQEAHDNYAILQRMLSLGNIKAAKAFFPQRVTDSDLRALGKAMSETTDPRAAIQMMLDFRRNANQREIAYSDFMQNRNTTPENAGNYEKDWGESPIGKQSIWEAGPLLKYGSVGTPKAGSEEEKRGLLPVKTRVGSTVWATHDAQGNLVPWSAS